MNPRILVCRTDAIGDTVLTLPVVNDLRTAFPNAFIAYCGQELTKPLLLNCPQIDKVLCYSNNKYFGKTIAEFEFDVAIMCYPGPVRLAWRLYSCSIPIRIGSKRRWWGILFNYGSHLSRAGSQMHESEANRHLGAIAIRALGGNDDVCKKDAQVMLQVANKDILSIKRYLAQLGVGNKYLVIQPGSSGSSVDWPIERMASVADRLQQEGKTVLFHIGPGESAIEKRLRKLCNKRQFFIGTGSSDKKNIYLPQLAAVLKGASCVLGNSTGPLHLASVLGTPVVGLYPPIRNLDPGRWRPLGCKQIILMPPYQKLYETREQAPDDIMNLISVDEVCTAINKL